MSKIQAMFSARGRRLFDSEKEEMDAFNAKYGHSVDPPAAERSTARTWGKRAVVVNVVGSDQPSGSPERPSAEQGRLAKRWSKRAQSFRERAKSRATPEVEGSVVYRDARSGRLVVTRPDELEGTVEFLQKHKIPA